MSKLFMLVGISGSGKSTWAYINKDSLFSDIYSSDDYRERLLGNVNDQTKNNFIFKQLHKDIKAALLSGKSVCYDATNLSIHDRKRFLKQLPANQNIEKIAVFFNTDLNTAIAQNNKRERVVPEEVILRQSLKLVKPTFDEGFTEIRTITFKN